MQVEITIAHADAAGRNYLTWAPVQASIRCIDGDPGAPVAVTVSNDDPDVGGQLEFATARTKERASSLDLVVPPDGTPVEFWVAGAVGRPSSADGDAAILVSRQDSARKLASKAVMVRIRKDANTLSPAERDRFTTAFAKLNDRGAGLFKAFREMHRERAALQQAHGAPGFLAWHRAYLLDLERELQKIDPSVTLPYWRFDRPAPNVFTPEFMGRTIEGTTTVAFAPANLLGQWQTDGAVGVSRIPAFETDTEPANVVDDDTTLILGGQRPNAVFDTGQVGELGELGGFSGLGGFDVMELQPHGNAHTSFELWISGQPTAPRDPLFFLLHSNVDRLWARWQWFHDRFDGTNANTYFFRGSATSSPRTRIGHNLLDTMWPWNNVTGFPRPDTAPRTPLPVVPTAPGPGPAPTVGDMIDYQGLLRADSDMNFAYDDVPFGVAP